MSGRVFGITGWKNSGKTQLTERLVTHFTQQGLRVATIKHAHHSFDIDQAGTDSYRHRVAGAIETAIVSSQRWALMHELRNEKEPDLLEILHRLGPSDIVLVEGFKNGDHPKIECRRMDARDTSPLNDKIPNVVAIACEAPQESPISPRQFCLDDIDAISSFILTLLHIEV